MTFFDPRMADGAARAVLMTGPFGDPERVIDLARPMTVAEIIAEHDLAFRLPTIAVMNGEPVMRGEWNVRMVRETEVITFVAVPRGGGDNSNTKQIVGLVAALALSVAAPMIGGWVAGAFFGGSTLAASVVSAALLAGGSLLLNTMLTPAQTPTDQSQAERVYSANAASNQATPLEVLPVLYGRLKFPPRYASRPYSEYHGNDQYLYQLFAVTAGKAAIEKIFIGETEAWNSTDGYSSTYSDITFQIVQPGDDVTLFPANVVTSTEVAGQQVPDPTDVLGPFVINAAGTTINRIAVDFAFPAGLYTVDKKGVANKSVKLRAQYQAVDDDGEATGSWTDIFRQTITYATRTPQRLTKAINVTAGRYQVRFLSEQAFSSDNSNAVDTVVWTGLRGYLTGFVTPPNCTLLAMRAKANEQLSQASSSQIKVIASRHLPVWDGSDWVEQATDSIAWAAADLLRNTDYGLGLSELQYDLTTLGTLASTWAGRSDSFNAIFDRSWTAGEALKAILRAGRAAPVRIAGKIGFNRLEPKSIKRAVFSQRNVVRGSFQHKLVLFDDEKPDSVTGSYLDQTVWDTREVVGSIGSIGADAPQKIEYFGITDHDQAWREAVTDAAVNAYQREFVSFTSEWEGKLLVRGDPVLVQHPFIEGVATAALAARNGRELTIDRDLDAPEDDGYVVLRGYDGREWGPCLVESIDGRKITLDDTDLTIVEATMGDLDDILPNDREEPATVLLCDGETRPFDGLIVSAIPNGDGKVDVLCVVDAAEVYAADQTETMPSPWAEPTLPPALAERPLVLGLYAELHAGVADLELEAMWRPAPGATSYVAEVSYDDGETWTRVYDGSANRFTIVVLPQALKLRVAAIGSQPGPWTLKTFDPGDVPVVGLDGEYLLAGAVDLKKLADDVRGWQEWVGAQSIRSLLAEMDNLTELVAESGASTTTVIDRLRREATATYETITASYSEEITTLAGVVDGKLVGLSSRVEELSVQIDTDVAEAIDAVTVQIEAVDGDVTASLNALKALNGSVDGKEASAIFRMGQDYAAASGWDSRIGFETRDDVEDDFSAAGLFLESKAGAGRIVLSASQTAIMAPDNTVLALFDASSGEVWIDNARIHDLDADNIDVANLFAQDAAIQGDLTVGSSILIDGPNGRIVVSD